MGIVNFNTVRPDELKAGDVLIATVTLHVQYHNGSNGKPSFRVYRCDYPPQTQGGIPQGARVGAAAAKSVADHIFPVVGWAGLKAEG